MMGLDKEPLFMCFGRMFLWMVGTTFAGMAVAVPVARALDVNAVNSGMGEESLQPVVVTPTVAVSPVVVSASGAVAPVSVTVGDAGVSETFRVTGVVVELTDTQGFGRDAALERAARDSLPTVLVRVGLTPEDAAKKVKSLGSAMRFVQGYKVVKESLIPHYSLTADLTFSEAMVVKNFGAALPPKPQVAAANVDEASAVMAGPPLQQWVVTVEGSPANVDRVRVNLNAQASTQAHYRTLTSRGAELLVETPLDASQLQAAAGMRIQVVALEALVPAAAAEVPQPELRPWQGQDDRMESGYVPAGEVAPLPPQQPWSRPWSQY